MNNKNLSQELRPPGAVNRGLDRNSKVDIKEICKKFENMSGVPDSNLSKEIAQSPIPPTRKKKSSNNVSGKIANRISSDDLRSTPLKHSISSEMPNSKQSSVKERTKLFESPVEINKNSLHTEKKLVKGNLRLSASVTGVNAKVHNGSNKSFDCDKVPPSYVNTPPAKPPRSFAHSDINAEKLSKNVLDGDEKLKSCNSSESKVRNTSSFSFETKAEEQTPKSSRLNSAPEIFSSSKKTPQSTSKSLKFSGKTQTIFNYFKNISSTANNIREKVKQKHSNIFVDLTSTTVSPPKHYSTLKRSLSEEHIYAEPAVVCQSNSNKSDDKDSEPLHYMVMIKFLVVSILIFYVYT